MSSTINENEDFEGGQFTPFQDTDTPRVQKAIQNFANATQGYDTAQINQYRQGVSIRTSRHLFETTQPKIWAGNLGHAVRVITIGQARDFTEFEDDPKFEELPEFNPSWYIEDEDYPFPIIFNNGPQQEEEAIVEPFTIPFRKANPFGNFVPRTPKAGLEDGNNFDNYDGGTNRVEQFIEYNQPRTARFFLDEGVEYWGPTAYATVFGAATSYEPTASYIFDNTSLDLTDTGYNLTLASGTLAYGAGLPRSETVTNSLVLDNFTVLTGATDSTLQVTGAISVQGFVNVSEQESQYLFVIGGDTSSAAENDNILFAVIMSTIFNRIIYTHQTSAAQTLAQVSGNYAWSLNNWFHFAVTRTENGFVRIYSDGVLLGQGQTTPPTAGGSPQQFLQVGGVYLGAAVPPYGAEFSGSIAGLKFHDTVLSEEQIFAEYAAGFPYESGRDDAALRQSVKVDGYVAFIQRDADPFDDTGDERIVEQISTTDATFISRLKELDFDLSEDIRGTFTKKSAAAGGDVYGPDSARYGTDSIAYRGLIRGS